MMHGKFGQHLPERALFCRDEEEVMHQIFMALFRGGCHYQPSLEIIFQGRLMPPAAPKNGVHFQERLMAPAVPGNLIFRGR